MLQAGHWVKTGRWEGILYQTLTVRLLMDRTRNCIAPVPGGTIDFRLLEDSRQNNIPGHKIGISRSLPCWQDIDTGYERGYWIHRDPIATGQEGPRRHGIRKGWARTARALGRKANTLVTCQNCVNSCATCRARSWIGLDNGRRTVGDRQD